MTVSSQRQDGPVGEWLGLGTFGKVWCNRVYICGADVTPHDNEAGSDYQMYP